MLLPNTAGCKAILDEFEKELNAWFIKIYDIELFIASGYVECSADELMDKCFSGSNTMERVSDTVIESVVTGQSMQDTLQSYIGYNVLKDTSVDEYVRMLKETFGTSVYE